MSREPRAVLLLLGLAIAGHAGRLLWSRPDAPPGEILSAAASADANPGRQRALAEHLARPLASNETVDINAASAQEIARLPRIGMSLAKRIVGDRTAGGRFRGPGDLERVPGVGPALLQILHDKVRYGETGPEVPVAPEDANFSSTGAYAARAGPGDSPQIDLNLASLKELMTLPGVGAARARAIVAYRRDKGSFAAVSDLERVTGFGRSLVARLAPSLTVR